VAVHTTGGCTDADVEGLLGSMDADVASHWVGDFSVRVLTWNDRWSYDSDVEIDRAC